MREFGIRPNRDLGQNFLVDSNILDVIGRLAELTPEDVVLEVGGGLGVLSPSTSPSARAHVHVVELDRGLEPALRDALDPHPNTTLHFADAVKLDLDALDPAPEQGRRQPALRRRRDRDPADDRARDASTRWVAMVQKEVGERFAAAPSHVAPTASRRCSPSSPATCASARKIPRGVFYPVPNVDSVLVGLERHGAGAAATSLRHARPARLRAPPQGAGAARSRWPRAPAESIRDRTREALVALGHPADARAESLCPADWRALWERLC